MKQHKHWDTLFAVFFSISPYAWFAVFLIGLSAAYVARWLGVVA